MERKSEAYFDRHLEMWRIDLMETICEPEKKTAEEKAKYTLMLYEAAKRHFASYEFHKAGIQVLHDRIQELEGVLKEFADSPQYMHVPNWVVIKCEQALKRKPHECKTCWYSCDVKNIRECPLILKAKEGNVDTKT